MSSIDSTRINLDVDQKLYEEAMTLLKERGLSMEEVLLSFLEHFVKSENALPDEDEDLEGSKDSYLKNSLTSFEQLHLDIQS